MLNKMHYDREILENHEKDETLSYFIWSEFKRQGRPQIVRLLETFWDRLWMWIVGVAVGIAVICGIYLYGQGQTSQAFEKAREHGVYYMNAHDYDTALANFNRMIELDDGEPDGFYYRGYLQMLRSYDESNAELCPVAATDLETAIELGDEDEFPKLADAHFSLGKIYYAQEKIDESIAEFSETIRICTIKHDEFEEENLDRIHGEALLWRSRVYANQNMVDKSLEDLRQAITFEETRPEAFAYISRIHLIHNNLDKSLRALNNEIMIYETRDPLSPQLGSAYFRRGHVRLLMQDYEAAIIDYRRTLARHPEYGEARNYIQLAEWFLQQKNSFQAENSGMASL